MSSVRFASESCFPEVREYVSWTLAWITVPEGSGTEDCTARVATEVPPVGETERGFNEPVAAEPAVRATMFTPARACPDDGTTIAEFPTSGVTSAKSPTEGIGIVSVPFTAPRFGVNISHALVP